MPVNVEPTDTHDVPNYDRAAKAETHSDNLRAKANTSLLLEELGAPFDEPTEDEKQEARLLFSQIDGKDPSKEVQKQQVAAASNPGIASALGGYISHYDQQVIHDKVSLRNIAVNRLLELSQEEDNKIAIKAVELLGKAGDLFTEHQEITITHKNSLELQEAIREKIRLLMEMNTIDVTPKAEKLVNSLDTEIIDLDE